MDNITTSQIAEFSKTQKLDITEQLEHDIRYLDIKIVVKYIYLMIIFLA